jgi:hypothetical protein
MRSVCRFYVEKGAARCGWASAQRWYAGERGYGASQRYAAQVGGARLVWAIRYLANRARAGTANVSAGFMRYGATAYAAVPALKIALR